MVNTRRDQFRLTLAVGRQFAHLVKTQGGVEPGLKSLKQLSKKEYQQAIADVESLFTDSGSQLTENMGQLSTLLNLVKLVRIEGGDEIAVFSNFENILKSFDSLSLNLGQNFRAFFAYLISVLSTSVVVASALLVFVLPQFESVYEEFGGTLPYLTRLVLGNGGVFFVTVLITLGLLFGVTAIFISRFKVSQKYFRPLHRSLRSIIFFRRLADGYNRLLSIHYALLLIKCGLSSRRSLVLASNFAEDSAMARFFNNDSTLKSDNDNDLKILELAIEADNLESELEYLLANHSSQLNYRFQSMQQKVIWIFHIMLAVFVGFLVIAMYLPIFKMGELA